MKAGIRLRRRISSALDALPAHCLLVSIGSRAPYPLPEIYCLQQLTMGIPAKILGE
jgi:hypothetical protein